MHAHANAMMQICKGRPRLNSACFTSQVSKMPYHQRQSEIEFIIRLQSCHQRQHRHRDDPDDERFQNLGRLHTRMRCHGGEKNFGSRRFDRW
jgi:hypothetical protein